MDINCVHLQQQIINQNCSHEEIKVKKVKVMLCHEDTSCA